MKHHNLYPDTRVTPGGRKVLERYGLEHFAELGRKGSRAGQRRFTKAQYVAWGKLGGRKPAGKKRKTA